jgi:hypothetical protein
MNDFRNVLGAIWEKFNCSAHNGCGYTITNEPIWRWGVAHQSSFCSRLNKVSTFKARAKEKPHQGEITEKYRLRSMLCNAFFVFKNTKAKHRSDGLI